MVQATQCDLTLLVAGDPNQLTGGYVYDARIVAALRGRGWQVAVQGLEGRFPDPDVSARDSLNQALSALPEGARVVIDGLAMGGLPEVIAAHVERLTIVALVHHPLADETGLDPVAKARLFDSESRALNLVHRVIVTSPYTGRGLARYGVPSERIRIVEPGVDSAPLAASATDIEVPGPPRLLCVATLTPRKGHDLLLEALAELVDRDWTCEIIGSQTRDPEHVAELLDQAQRLGLDMRLTWLGERDAKGLAEAYHRAALFVLPSHYEGYGMVVTEALARGLPVITTTGGALVDTLPPQAGIAVPPGDAPALREALAAWFDDPALRRRLRRGARQAREALADWQQAGDYFRAAIEDLGTQKACMATGSTAQEANQ